MIFMYSTPINYELILDIVYNITNVYIIYHNIIYICIYKVLIDCVKEENGDEIMKHYAVKVRNYHT